MQPLTRVTSRSGHFIPGDASIYRRGSRVALWAGVQQNQALVHKVRVLNVRTKTDQVQEMFANI